MTAKSRVHWRIKFYHAFALDWTRVAETRFSGNKGLPDDNAAPRRQKVRNSTLVVRKLRQKLKSDRLLDLRSYRLSSIASIRERPPRSSVREPPGSCVNPEGRVWQPVQVDLTAMAVTPGGAMSAWTPSPGIAARGGCPFICFIVSRPLDQRDGAQIHAHVRWTSNH